MTELKWEKIPLIMVGSFKQPTLTKEQTDLEKQYISRWYEQDSQQTWLVTNSSVSNNDRIHILFQVIMEHLSIVGP